VDLSELRVFVLDEADDFYMDSKKEQEINTFHAFINTKLKRTVQYIFFSATFDTAISEKISAIVSDANQINLKQEQLKLDNIQQYYMKCAKNGKLQFIKDVYESITGKTQTIIFVNSRDFAVKVFTFLKDDGYQVSLIMGGDMSKEERDRQIEKFREGATTVVITTDLLARGFDMPTIQLVINYDVPHKKGNPEYELYLHRIGRSGRFGTPGVAVTLFDREEDEEVFWKIIEKY
jgi:ATP-dependent RNA helicase DDX19/DBP5